MRRREFITLLGSAVAARPREIFHETAQLHRTFGQRGLRLAALLAIADEVIECNDASS